MRDMIYIVLLFENGFLIQIMSYRLSIIKQKRYTNYFSVKSIFMSVKQLSYLGLYLTQK